MIQNVLQKLINKGTEKIKLKGEYMLDNKSGKLSIKINNIEKEKEPQFEGTVIGELKEEFVDILKNPFISLDYDRLDKRDSEVDDKFEIEVNSKYQSWFTINDYIQIVK